MVEPETVDSTSLSPVIVPSGAVVASATTDALRWTVWVKKRAAEQEVRAALLDQQPEALLRARIMVEPWLVRRRGLQEPVEPRVGCLRAPLEGHDLRPGDAIDERFVGRELEIEPGRRASVALRRSVARGAAVGTFAGESAQIREEGAARQRERRDAGSETPPRSAPHAKHRGEATRALARGSAEVRPARGPSLSRLQRHRNSHKGAHRQLRPAAASLSETASFSSSPAAPGYSLDSPTREGSGAASSTL